MKLLKGLFGGILFMQLVACGGNGKTAHGETADDSLMQALAGVWVDENTDTPMFVIRADSITYLATGRAGLPAKFMVEGDTLVVFGSETVKYSGFKLNGRTLQFITPFGDLVALHKSDQRDLPIEEMIHIEQTTEVIRRDSVVNFKGERYRGYVYINPTSKKVVVQTISEEGLPVDNVYYDNIIHICVYQGKIQKYASDIKKEQFANLVPSDFLERAILSEMEFRGVDAQGYHYRAQLCTPEESICYYIDLLITSDGKLTCKLLQ